jgi:DNA repair protein RecN (Recombination protein N)
MNVDYLKDYTIMLREIHIKNLALIEELTLEFNNGFNIFTGETGAGKSILIGAIGLLLGERASADMVRSGYDEAEVSGVFDLVNIKDGLMNLLETLSVNVDDRELIIRRKVSRGDRNRILVNQVPVPLSSLKLIGNYLIDFHGQHEHQSLLNEDEHVKIIDSLPGVSAYRKNYDEAYCQYIQAINDLDGYKKKASQLAERQEILEFQHKEIKSLDLKHGEEDELEAELALLSTSAERSGCASEIISLLGNGTESVERKVAAIRRKLETLVKYDTAVSPWLTDVENALSTLTELETFCGSYLERSGGTADPRRIEFLNARLAKIQRLKKKYNVSLDGLVDKCHQIENDLKSLENSDADIAEFEKKAAQLSLKCKAAGSDLSRVRKQHAAEFDTKISAVLKTLGFSSGVLSTNCHPHKEPAPDGLEKMTFLVQTNKGEPFLPLAKTASGGEISRIMLAIKSVLAEHDQVPVLIFDEIDTGIGGVLASEVGKAMYALSKTHQLLCITHLHQIASLADYHYKVHKQTAGERTITKVSVLDGDEKVDEIARMLGGNSEISLKHARELIGKSKH